MQLLRLLLASSNLVLCQKHHDGALQQHMISSTHESWNSHFCTQSVNSPLLTRIFTHEKHLHEQINDVRQQRILKDKQSLKL